MCLFVPLGWLFSRFGLEWFWLTFPVTELVTTLVGFVFYRQFLAAPYRETTRKHKHVEHKDAVIQPSSPA